MNIKLNKDYAELDISSFLFDVAFIYFEYLSLNYLMLYCLNFIYILYTSFSLILTVEKKFIISFNIILKS